LGYGYDNDMSYRLSQTGYRLSICRTARSFHQWRQGLAGYLVQQYGFGYGRLDVVAKHPRRWRGDSVSPAGMMAHPFLMTIALIAVAVALIQALSGANWQPSLSAAAGLVAMLAGERLIAGARAAIRFRTLAPLWFPLLHLARDLAWVAAVVMWS